VTVCEAQRVDRHADILAAGVDEGGLVQHVLDLAAISPGIHPHRPTERAGDAAEELEPRDACLCGHLGDVEIECGGARGYRLAVGLDAGEAAAKAYRHPGDSAVAHQEVRGNTDHRYRNVLRFGGKEGLQVRQVDGTEEHLGWSAHAKPGNPGKRRPGAQAPTHRRQTVDQIHALPLRHEHHDPAPASLGLGTSSRASSSPGRAFAQALMLPAPRHTTMSPGPAFWATRGASCCASSRASTLR
jgi:hypothetical protein